MNQILLEAEKALKTLSLIPYENLSKVVSFDKWGDPSKVIGNSTSSQKLLEWSGGGTCFSLTYLLREKLLQKNIDSEYVMGDKYSLSNIHCGLLITVEKEQYLLDPGYLIYSPLRLPKEGMETFSNLTPNPVWLQDRSHEGLWRMFTGKGSEKKWRFDFRKKPVTHEAFVEYWKQTFFFDMMDYPVLNKMEEGIQYYLQKNTFVKRSAEDSSMEKIDRNQFHTIATKLYRLSEPLVNSYLEVLDRTSKKNPFLKTKVKATL